MNAPGTATSSGIGTWVFLHHAWKSFSFVEGGAFLLPLSFGGNFVLLSPGWFFPPEASHILDGKSAMFDNESTYSIQMMGGISLPQVADLCQNV